MRVGYARVSTKEQSVAMQVDALRAAGCDRVYEEVASGARADRPVLEDLLAHLRGGDVADRCGRTLSGSWTGWGAASNTWSR
jgi:DNA invertase Pin-like site-specific DNA recombinase